MIWEELTVEEVQDLLGSLLVTFYESLQSVTRKPRGYSRLLTPHEVLPRHALAKSLEYNTKRVYLPGVAKIHSSKAQWADANSGSR